MRLLIAITILLTIISCSGPRLKFALTNHLDSEIRNVEVRLPDTTLFYASVKPHTQTEWIKVSRAHSAAYLKFRDQSDSERVYIPMIMETDKQYKKGYLQYLVYPPDSSKPDIGTAFSRTPWMSTNAPEEKE